MVEIAICLGVIGIALVAIIGVMPSGMRVQRDNREETIVTQDGMYFMETIRGGARGADHLTNFFEEIRVGGAQKQFTTGDDIIGLMSTPNSVNTAIVRALAGSAAEKGPRANNVVTFRYQLTSEIQPFTPGGGAYASQLRSNLYDVRLSFDWPLRGTNTLAPNAGNTSPRVFRAQVCAQLVPDTNNASLFFFRQ